MEAGDERLVGGVERPDPQRRLPRLGRRRRQRCGRRSAGDVAQGADPGEEEVGAAPHRHELRHAGEPARGPVGPGQREDAGLPVARQRRPAPQQRVGLVDEARELRALDPGVLHELELPGGVRDQADEVQAALLVLPAGLERPVRRQRRAVLAPPPQQAVEPRRGDQVLARRPPREAELAGQAREAAVRARGQVARARVGAPDVGAEGAVVALGVGRVGEPVRGDVLRAPARPRRSAPPRAAPAGRRPGCARPSPAPAASAPRAGRRPGRRGTARTRARPGAAAGTRGRRRCGRGPAGRARPPPAAGRPPAGPRAGR